MTISASGSPAGCEGPPLLSLLSRCSVFTLDILASTGDTAAGCESPCGLAGTWTDVRFVGSTTASSDSPSLGQEECRRV